MPAPTFEDRLDISCPNCGGNSTWRLLQSLNRCQYCDSVLYRVYHESQPQYLVAESTVESPEQLIDVLATYDAMRQVSNARGDIPRDDSSPFRLELGSGFADTEVYQVKDRRKHLFRLLQSHPLHVPYLLLCSTIVYDVLGRVSAGTRKIYRAMFFDSEDVMPAYQEPWDFRDKGLLLSLQRLKPFDPEMQKHSHFLAPRPTASLENQPPLYVLKQSGILKRELDPICFEASLVMLRRWIVFRPYDYVQAQTPDGVRWFLIDKQFGTIAGDPRSDELARIQGNHLPLLEVTKDLLLEVKAIPFRCPECGWDVEMNKRSVYQVCGNCTRLLETTEHGLRSLSYEASQFVPWQKSATGRSAWLPFWRCRLKTNLSQILTRLIPPMALRRVSLPNNWNTIFVPAFESWDLDRYDDWAFQSAIELSMMDESPPCEELLHTAMQQSDEVMPPAYDADMVRSLFPRILPFYFPAVLHAQLNIALLKQVGQLNLEVASMEIVYFPLPVIQSGGEVRIAGAHGTVEWKPLQTGEWPPALHRTMRRWRTNPDGNTN